MGTSAVTCCLLRCWRGYKGNREGNVGVDMMMIFHCMPVRDFSKNENIIENNNFRSCCCMEVR